jgi:geranylgeranyl pyrophosphate synthase
MDFSHPFLKQIPAQIEIKLKAILEQHPCPCTRLNQALHYTLLGSGKRIRAALVYATAEMLGQIHSPLQCAPLLHETACAIEIIHTYSLIHDDLPCMDNDILRRGRPTCHIAFDEPTALLAGDALNTLAFQVLSRGSDHAKIRLQIIQIVSQAAGAQGMVAGQSLEFNLECHQVSHGGDLHSLSDIQQRYSLKTGQLIVAALHCAAIGAYAPAPIVQILCDLGYLLGLAFQIQDDILDLTQTTEQLGKPAMSDFRRDLPTYPSRCGLDQSILDLDILLEHISDRLDQLPHSGGTLRALVNDIAKRKL